MYAANTMAMYRHKLVVLVCNIFSSKCEVMIENFIRTDNKRCPDGQNTNFTMSVKSETVCSLKCLQYGESCCYSEFVKLTKTCAVVTSGCCRTNLEDLFGTIILQRKRKLLGKSFV